MKRIAAIIFLLALVALTGCGTTESFSQNDVLSRSIEAIEDLESYSIDMDMAVNMMEMETNMTFKGDVTHNPDAMHLTMSMGMSGMAMDFEVYSLDDMVYMSMLGEWIKVDAAEMGLDDLDQLNEEEMKKFLEFSDDFTMVEEDDVYILSLSGDEGNYSVLIEDYLKSGMGDFNDDPHVKEMLETVQINDFNLELYIEKGTYIQTKQIIYADMVITEEGMSFPISISGTVDISNVNGVESIELPAEVLENAVEEDEVF
ncbi:hypothetical protein N0O92_12375 [Alkalihalobacillus sp. MEB130]|uniref:DUF6612 family protein n=1 Tax=Alkalihalobacillus sp. MEB130 TaxID=2976704 RepID=UPI0028DD5242|nr:DUF6612 family protein [Alkalihalobacillus sp. MEB130]MDT8861030.1 hypothetical protein [Alkalihalobacillus sp. MEB130]